MYNKIVLLALFLSLTIIGCSMIQTNFVLRSDLEQLAASGPYNNNELATEICGTPVDFLGAPDRSEPATALPRARLLSSQFFYPMEGTASARIAGVGVSRESMKAITGPCEATINFRYRCAWVDNGRSVILEKNFLDVPKVVRRQ